MDAFTPIYIFNELKISLQRGKYPVVITFVWLEYRSSIKEKDAFGIIFLLTKHIPYLELKTLK